MLDRHGAARSGRGDRLLRRRVRLAVRGSHAARCARPVRRRPARGPRRRRRGVGRGPRSGVRTRRCGTPTSGSTTSRRRRPRWNGPAAPSSAAPSTSGPPGGWPSSSTRPVRHCGCGRPARTGVPGSSTPPARGTGATSRPPTSPPARRVLRRGVRLGGRRRRRRRRHGDDVAAARVTATSWTARSRGCAAARRPTGCHRASPTPSPGCCRRRTARDARWTITFAVDDTDAVVQRAVDLGGVGPASRRSMPARCEPRTSPTRRARRSRSTATTPAGA